MDLALIIDLVLFGLFTGFLIALSIDEAREEKIRNKILEPEELKTAA